MSQVILKEEKKYSPTAYFSSEKIDLIKNLYCKDANDEELKLFLMICQKVKLDPCARQIFAVFRKDYKTNKHSMTIQTGIDGYRLIADRTGKYAPGRDTEYGYDKNGNILWAKAYVKKMTLDGTWHEISATAFWNEYVVMYGNKMSTFWATKGHIMLSKCAEALALRKTFPAELSGLYTKEEMGNLSYEEKENQSVPEEKTDSCIENPIMKNQIETIQRIIQLGRGNENKILQWYLTKYEKNTDGSWEDFTALEGVSIIEELIKVKNKKTQQNKKTQKEKLCSKIQSNG